MALESSVSQTAAAALARLSSPVEVRFYCALDSNTVPPSMFAYAHRVDQLLATYEAASAGKVKVASDWGDLDKASQEGLLGFNREKGTVCYLGLVIESDGRKEVLPRLDPEWEQALEADVGRAIQRVTAPLPPAPGAVASATNPELQEQVKRQLPDFESLSADQATQRLRRASLEEFKTVITETAPRIKAAEERLKGAQNAADQEQARQELRQLEAAQAERLQEITAKAQAQVEAVLQMKGQGAQPGTKPQTTGRRVRRSSAD